MTRSTSSAKRSSVPRWIAILAINPIIQAVVICVIMITIAIERGELIHSLFGVIPQSQTTPLVIVIITIIFIVGITHHFTSKLIDLMRDGQLLSAPVRVGKSRTHVEPPGGHEHPAANAG